MLNREEFFGQTKTSQKLGEFHIVSRVTAHQPSRFWSYCGHRLLEDSLTHNTDGRHVCLNCRRLYSHP